MVSISQKTKKEKRSPLKTTPRALPAYIRPIAEIVPLTHSVRLVRAVCANNYRPILLFDLLYIVGFILVVGFFAIRRLRKRLVN